VPRTAVLRKKRVGIAAPNGLKASTSSLSRHEALGVPVVVRNGAIPSRNEEHRWGNSAQTVCRSSCVPHDRWTLSASGAIIGKCTSTPCLGASPVNVSASLLEAVPVSVDNTT